MSQNDQVTASKTHFKGPEQKLLKISCLHCRVALNADDFWLPHLHEVITEDYLTDDDVTI